MEIKEITEQKVLDAFIGLQKMSQFLQSWLWGEFQKKLGRKVWRLGVFEDDSLLGSVLVVRYILPLGRNYLYCPRGPIVEDQLLRLRQGSGGRAMTEFQTVFKELLKEIVSRAQEQGTMFVKLEPPFEKSSQHVFEEITKDYNIYQVDFIQPQDSWYLDLEKSEEELLQNMHHKTRYNIRLAEKKNVTVRLAESDEDFEKFWQLNLVTVKRDQFRSHSRDYYYQMFNTLRNSGFLKLYLAEYNNEVLAANIVMFFGDSVTYVHGASSDLHRNVMAPHLLQWQQIQQAKKDGFRIFDFWGVAPTDASENHPWSGISRFKKSFGGKGISYVGAYDLILDKMWYKLYKLTYTIKH